MSRAIVVDGVSKRYGRVEALRNVSLTVDEGEVFGLIGPDGAGKTSLFRIMATLILADSGKVSVDGYDVVTGMDRIRQRVGYVPGKFSLYQDLTVEENLEFFATLFGTTVAAEYDHIKAIYSQIEPFKNRKAGALSGGMKQKLALYDDLTVRENIRLFAGIYGMSDTDIRRKTDELLDRLAFAEHGDDIVASLPLGWKQKLAFSVSIFHDPEIVFLDEPTGGVDPATRRQFWQLIYDAADRGITVFVTTHYMDEAEYCDRISIMVDGKIKAMGTPDELKRSLKQPDMDHVFTYLARQSTRQ